MQAETWASLEAASDTVAAIEAAGRAAAAVVPVVPWRRTGLIGKEGSRTASTLKRLYH